MLIFKVFLDNFKSGGMEIEIRLSALGIEKKQCFSCFTMLTLRDNLRWKIIIMLAKPFINKFYTNHCVQQEEVV